MPSETIDDVTGIGDDAGDRPLPVVVLLGAEIAGEPRCFPVGGDGLVLGRRISAPGVETTDIADERMSREHAEVRFDRGTWTITDRDSRNGTFVDGERAIAVTQRRGDTVVRLGHSVFLLIGDGRGHEQPIRTVADHVVGPELARVLERVRRHGSSPTLLVHGERGSGKEMAARLFHDAGPRAGGPFVVVNCAAIPEGSAERLLFGSRNGAFSDAGDATGYLQSAHGGTLFLDEIAELDGTVQAKLLRAIEALEVVPVGASQGTRVEVGVVVASRRELSAAVADGGFRDDLYCRLTRAVVRLPPLRQRRRDIAQLVMREVTTVDRGLTAHPRLIEASCLRPWPGNVRELRDAVHEAALAALAAGRKVVRSDDLPPGAGAPVPASAGAPPPP